MAEDKAEELAMQINALFTRSDGNVLRDVAALLREHLGEREQGTCDIARHSNGWVTIAPGVRHIQMPDCVNWRPLPAPPKEGGTR